MHVNMIAIRSHFAPDNIEGVQVGDTVTSTSPTSSRTGTCLHGFAVLGADNSELLMHAGRDADAEWVPKRVGVYPVLLHRLLLGAAPGDAGLRPGVAEGLER